MDVCTLDWETYYDTASGYTLKKMPTEDYVMSDRFEAIGVGAWINDQPYGWFSGTHGQTADWLKKLDLPSKVLCGHHLMFDGLITQAQFGIVPAYYACTESMCRPFLKPILKSLSLGSVSHYLQLGEKGEEVVYADGMGRRDFMPDDLYKYLHDYCLMGDCKLTRGIYNWARPQLNADEMLLIDQTMRMYTQPMFKLDAAHYAASLRDVREQQTLRRAEMELQGVTAEVLRSNKQFAALLVARGVEPPMKVSLSWLKKPVADRDPAKKMTYAFSKADPEYIALREAYAEDPAISVLLDARISEMSSIEETRNAALLEEATKYPRFRVDIGYYNAHTGRYTSKEQEHNR